MIFGSVCSGIEAASVAAPEGWEAEFFSEIEKFPSAVLAHHYPDVPNMGDMTKFKDWKIKNAIRLLCGGTPCQSFSIAGLRKGLDDTRGNLMLTFGEMAAKFRPDWLLWENVPGVLSSNRGQDFASFLGLISGQSVSVPRGGWKKAGIISGHANAYGIAYRVFDAQYFGVAQCRRRVFVVGYIGDWRPAAAVLFERESLRGNPAPRREKREEITQSVAGSLGAGDGNRGWRNDLDQGAFIPSVTVSHDPTATLQTTCDDYSRADGFNMVAHTLRDEGFDASEDGTGRQNLVVATETGQGFWKESEVSATVRKGNDQGQGGARESTIVAFQQNQLGEVRTGEVAGTLNTNSNASGRNTPMISVRDVSGTITSNYGKRVDSSDTSLGPNVVFPGSTVRRLTPVECERLQGFPDGYTDIKPKGKPTPDGPRYKALGNSWAVPNVRWIFQRIDQVDKIIRGENA